MTLDPTPPGIHPTDAMLLLLADVRSDDDAAALVAELGLPDNDKSDTHATEPLAKLGPPDNDKSDKSDTHATEPLAKLGLEASGSLTAQDPFAPVLVAAAWSHLGACDQCSTRRRSLLGELTPAISSAHLDSSPEVASALERRVRTAVAQLVPTTTALPESLARPTPPRRRWFAGRAGVGISTPSGHGGTVARPWIVGIAAALLLVVGAAFALRPRTTEQSAVGTVPRRVEKAASPDTAGREKSLSPGTEAAATETGAAVEAGAMADEPAASTPATREAPPATTTGPRVDRDAPIPAAPEAVSGRASRLPVVPSPTRASSNTAGRAADAFGAQAGNAVPPQPAKKASTPVPAASAAAEPGPPAGSEPPTAGADLGTFVDTAGAFDSFAARAKTPTDAPATQLGPQPGAGSGNATNTASPAAAPPSAAAPPTEPVLCPTVKGSPRLPARIGDRAVLLVRTPDATADVVLDAVSCVELARRTNPPTSAPVGS